MSMHQDDFDQQLRDALRREDAPPDLLARVLEKVPPPRKSWWSGWQFPVLVAIAVVLLLAVNLELGRRSTQRMEGEAAKQQLMQALQVTGRTLQVVETKISGMSGMNQ